MREEKVEQEGYLQDGRKSERSSSKLQLQTLCNYGPFANPESVLHTCSGTYF